MHGIRTIIFILEAEFTPRDYDRFGVETLRSHGFQVKVWDISPVIHPEVHHPDSSSGSLSTGGLVRKFLHRKDIRDAIGLLDRSDLVLCFIGYSLSTLFLYRSLSRKKIPYAVMVTNALPAVRRFTGTVRLDTPMKALRRMADFLILRYYSLFGVEPAGICLYGGETSLRGIPYPVDIEEGKTVCLPLHAFDYDTWLGMGNSATSPDEVFGVFLDGYDFYHLDLRRMGEPIPPWVEIYFSNLRTFFDHVEKTLGVRIIVAAHPLSHYTAVQRTHFGERKVIQGKTAELVKRCRFVIVHASTAVNLAVLFQKPIIFITDHNYEKYPFGPYIEVMADELGKKLIYIDEPLDIDWGRELAVDKAVYYSYRRSYIKSEGSPDLPYWEIFAHFLKAEKEPIRAKNEKQANTP